MKIITKLVILTLSLLLVNANQYCDNLVKECRENFLAKCSAHNVILKSCCDLKLFTAPSGVYKIRKTTFDIANAYCDMTSDDGGWIVIQRNRKNSATNFNRNWTDYEQGFGDLNMDFWYGLQSLHCLTQRGQWEMRVDYQYLNKTWTYLQYNQFSVGSPSEEYPLTVGGFIGLGGTDWFAFTRPLNGMKFSTPENDNDNWSSRNCAAMFGSGWWFNNCGNISINGHRPYVSIRDVLSTEMKIRPKNCIIQ